MPTAWIQLSHILEPYLREVSPKNKQKLSPSPAMVQYSAFVLLTLGWYKLSCGSCSVVKEHSIIWPWYSTYMICVSVAEKQVCFCGIQLQWWCLFSRQFPSCGPVLPCTIHHPQPRHKVRLPQADIGVIHIIIRSWTLLKEPHDKKYTVFLRCLGKSFDTHNYILHTGSSSW